MDNTTHKKPTRKVRKKMDRTYDKLFGKNKEYAYLVVLQPIEEDDDYDDHDYNDPCYLMVENDERLGEILIKYTGSKCYVPKVFPLGKEMGFTVEIREPIIKLYPSKPEKIGPQDFTPESLLDVL